MSQIIQVGLLGDQIGRSRVKALHELLGELYNVNISYRLMDLAQLSKPVSILKELQRCRDEGFTGVNVTHPYKKEAFKHVETFDHFPEGLTSVNTVLFSKDRMRADNTDYSGFCRAYVRQFGQDCNAGKVLMLGAGGVGVAIAFGLKQVGTNELWLYDKVRDSAVGLAQLMQAGGMKVRVLGEQDIVDAMRQADGLINATPIGMFQYPGNPFPAEGTGSGRWAFDAVYTPENTEFLDNCRKKGMDTLSGFQLFLYQGLDAFKHFTGVSPEAEVVEPVFLEKYPLE
jgi:shikimate dehydrogenase